MAVAANGIAYHFDFDARAGEWRDDKGLGIEPLRFLQEFLKESVGLELRIK
jgi:hypothetical protein